MPTAWTVLLADADVLIDYHESDLGIVELVALDPRNGDVLALVAKPRAVVFMTPGRVEWGDDANRGRPPICAPDREDSKIPGKDSR